ncbi:phosphate ABC transporter permease subunit PstC [Jatrophihabitans sp. YIM 134969]
MSARELIELEAATSGTATAVDDGGDEPPASAQVLHSPGDAGPGGGASAQSGRVRLGDRLFGGTATASGVFVVLVIAAVAAFLLIKALPAITGDDANFLTSREWNVEGNRFGIAALLWVTVISSVIAMVLAVPVGVGIALFITMYAPPKLSGAVARVVDLLAAIPSIVYGVWGLLVFGPAFSEPVSKAFQAVLGWIPLFSDQGRAVQTIFTASVVLAIMILPIITAVSRDVFERTPRANIEASLALGATRWEMIRMAVLPYGKAGVVSGAMLGLGRALGETIAVTLILSTVADTAPFSFSIFNGGETFASKIALNAGEFSNPASTGPFIAAGLVLFVLTFVVNAAARFVVSRGVKA